MTWEALEGILSATGCEYARQGSFSESENIPDTYFAFWNLDTPEDGFYDNNPTRAVWHWQVYLYTKDPSIMYSKMDELIALARQSGFVPDGRAWDIPTDEPGYVGRSVRLLYVETISS